MLVAEQLAKRYRGRAVVHGVSLAVETGEVVGLLGPNGAGKTTCFYMVVGLVAPNDGQIILDGKDITRASMHQRARLGLGYLPQEASIFRRLSVADNIMAVLELRADLNRQQRRQALAQLMDDFSVDHLAGQSGISLSGVSGGALKSLALWPPTPRSSFSTNRLPASIRSRSVKSSASCSSSPSAISAS